MTSSQPYSSAPRETTGMPAGIPYIVSNEAGERFCYYGLRSILMVYMAKYMVDSTGQAAPLTGAEATEKFHVFVFAAYFFPVLGAFLADAFLGKYRTILCFSLVYCLGPLILVLDRTNFGLSAGLLLIALGSGGIKPCVSAHVGDQFGRKNHHLLSKVFGWFYFAINLGSFAAMISIPVLLEKWGPKVAFGTPAVVMVVATLVFWMGRRVFVHVPPAGAKEFGKQVFSAESIGAVKRLIPIFLFVTVFWSLYDQSSSKWVLQAEKMDRAMLGWTILPSQMQAMNPLLILLFIPLFDKVVYPLIGRWFQLTPLRKIGLGFFLTVPSFIIPALVEMAIAHGGKPHVIWQVLAYVLLTAGEICISVTALEFAYTQAPNKAKSVVMCLYTLAISFGNLFTALVNKMLGATGLDKSLSEANYYLFFAGFMAVAAFAFIGVAKAYKERTFLQEAA